MHKETWLCFDRWSVQITTFKRTGQVVMEVAVQMFDSRMTGHNKSEQVRVKKSEEPDRRFGGFYDRCTDSFNYLVSKIDGKYFMFCEFILFTL